MESKKFHIEPENDMLKALRNVKDNIQVILEMEVLQAQMKKKRYDELIKVGFNPDQALELCKRA